MRSLAVELPARRDEGHEGDGVDSSRGSDPYASGLGARNGRDGRDASAMPLRDALRALTAGGAASTANMTPEQLAELAQRLSGSGGIAAANLAAILGANAAGATGAAAGGMTGVRFVVFGVNDLACALPGESVQGIERLPDITPVPNVAGWVLGVVPLRGAVLSVVDLRGFLGLPTVPVSNRSRLLVVSQRGMTIGFAVDAILELRSDQPEALPVASASLVPWIAAYGAGVVEMGGRQVQLIDVQRLLFADKMQHYSTYGA